jgi:hypothetical protein
LSEAEDKPKATFKPPIRRETPADGPVRGLSSVEKSRKERGRIKRPPGRVVAWFLLVTAVALALYFRHASGENERVRQRLLADQRAVDAELGKLWYPLRDRLEGWTVELAKADEASLERVDKEALAGFSFQELPGIYLRLRVDQAESVESVRAAAATSLRDAFTACLMRTPGEDPLAGPECKTSVDCEPGKLCNEFFRCASPGQPYNLRIAYKSLFVLSPDWVRDVQDATNDLRLRALRATFDQANRVELPVAVSFLTKAQFFLVVIDERPPPPAGSTASAGADTAQSPEDADILAGNIYPARVGLWRLSDDKPLVRMRRKAGATLQDSAGSLTVDPSVRAATLRQAQSCALAQEVRCAVGDPGATCTR